MAKVQISNVVVLNNPAPFDAPFQFEVTIECIEDLPSDIECKIVYVGSAESEEHDQVLDSVLVGPVPAGKHLFVFEANAPDPAKIPAGDALGVTIVLVICSYLGKEFVRVGYYVNNDYTDPELRETPPEIPQWDKVQKNILATNPRVTRFKIDWETQQQQQPIIAQPENMAGSSQEKEQYVQMPPVEMSMDAHAMAF